MSRMQYLHLAPYMLEASFELLLARKKIFGKGGEKLLTKFPIDRAGSPVVFEEKAALKARNIARALHAAADRLPGEYNCLVRSLAATCMLRRRNVPAQLYIGVRTKSKTGFGAHAWVNACDINICGGGMEDEFKILSVHAV